MVNVKSLSYRIAFCGINCSLALIIMYAAIIPGLTYALPAVSGLLIWTIGEQINKKWAMLSFLACSLLSVMLTFEPEASAFFISFFGYYPVLRETIGKIKYAILRILLRFFIFNVTMVVTFQIVSRIVGLDKMLDGLEGFGDYAVYALWIFSNIAFICYEICLGQLKFAYTKWLKPKFMKRI